MAPIANGTSALRPSGSNTSTLSRSSAGHIGSTRELSVERKGRSLHVGETETFQRRDRRGDAQQLGRALDQTRDIARRHAAFRIQLGEQFADATVRIAAYGPTQRD